MRFDAEKHAEFHTAGVPQDLRDVITQLKGAFTFKEYREGRTKGSGGPLQP
jgi:hypothetical protein